MSTPKSSAPVSSPQKSLDWSPENEVKDHYPITPTHVVWEWYRADMADVAHQQLTGDIWAESIRLAKYARNTLLARGEKLDD